MATKTFNVGIIGYGLSAKVFHIPFIALTKGLKLHTIVQRSPKAGDSAPEDHPSVKHQTSTEALFADADVDVVIVSTPPNTHFALVSAALNAGKHVLVEKPFVPTAAEAETLARLAQEKGRVLVVYQNRRWDADFLTVQKLLREGTLGRLVEFETHFDRFRPDKPTAWKATLGMDAGNGPLHDLGSHLLDQVFVLFGAPSSVSAKFVNQREGRFVSGVGGLEEEPDSVTVWLFYEKTGLVVHVRIGVMSVESDQMRFWIRGTKGSYHKTGLDPQENQLRFGTKKLTDAGFGVDQLQPPGRLSRLTEDGKIVDEPVPNVEPETYLKFYEMFANSLATGKEEDAPVTATQAAQVLRIIEAARESAKTGKEVAFTS